MRVGEPHRPIDFQIETDRCLARQMLHGEMVDGERAPARRHCHLVEDRLVVERHRMRGNRDIRVPVSPLDVAGKAVLDLDDLIERQRAPHIDVEIDEKRSARPPYAATAHG